MTPGRGGAGSGWRSSRQDPGPSTIMPADAVPVPAPPAPLARDVGRLFQVLGMHSFRASVVDMTTQEFQATRLLGEDGELVDEHDRSPADSALPGMSALVSSLAHAPLDKTVEQPLGARRCVYAWRMDSERAIIAEARYHEPVDRPRELDIAAARLVCSTGLFGRTGETRLGAAAPPLHWTQPETTPSTVARGPALAGLGLSLAAAGLAAWLAWAALPAVRDEAQHVTQQSTRLRTMTDETLKATLTTALASGDYGEVQNQLGSFEALGYFRGALITNARQRVVAIAGQVDDTLRIGIELPDGTLPKTEVRDLVQGPERFGRLVIVKPAAADPALPDVAPLRTVAGVSTAAAALAALLMAWALRRRSPGQAAG